MNRSFLKLAFSSTVLFTSSAFGTTYTVTTNADSGAGSLRAAVISVNAAPTASDTIQFTAALNNSTITLASSLPPLNVTGTLLFDATPATNLTINGGGNQVFFFNAGGFIIQSTTPLTITDGVATGSTGGSPADIRGGGGGGGAGGGGAIFVNQGIGLILDNVILSNNSAVGGGGGTVGTSPVTGAAAGGGGGAGAFGGGNGGNGTNSGGGGGGGGFPGGGIGGNGPSSVTPPQAIGGNATPIPNQVGGALIGGGGGGGGVDFAPCTPCGTGGTGAVGNNGGNGGDEIGTPPQAGMGLGGGGGASDSVSSPMGGAGGSNGGGGGGGGVTGNVINGGAGGFGGGGGAGSCEGIEPGEPGGIGGAGGIGGGGGGGGLGGNEGAGGVSAFGGGTGGPGPGGGGGGAGMGGALFIHEGATVSITGTLSMTGNTAVGGAGGSVGGNPGGSGSGFGPDIFMVAGSTLNFVSSNPITLTNPIQTNPSATGVTINLSENTGHLILGNGATLPSNTIMSVNNTATLDLTSLGTNQTFASITGSAGVGTIAMGTNSITTTTASSVSYPGVITGSGSVTVTGSNTWTLTGTTASSYSGGTIIENGATLAIANDGNLGAAGASVTWIKNGGSIFSFPTLELNGTISTTRPFIFDSIISVINLQGNNLTSTAGGSSGPALLSVTGTGSSSTLFIESAFMHTGGTAIANSTVAVSGGGSITSTISINNNGIFDISAATNPQTIGALTGSSTTGQLKLGNQTLTINPLVDTTFPGVIADTGGSHLILNRPQTLTLTGTSTMTGTVEIAQGTIVVASTATVPAHFQVDGPGTLKGTGTVGSVSNSGVVAPGMSIGTLNINPGPYIESGTLQIEGNDLGQSSSINVTGNIIINPGTTLLGIPDPGNYNSNLIFTVATFTGTRTGEYSTVKANLFNRFTLTAIYNPQNIQVELFVNPFSTIVPNDPASKCIESISTGTDGLAVINALEMISNSIPALEKAFYQLQPSQFGALAMAQENNDILVRSALTQRFGYRRVFERDDPTQPPPPTLKGSVWVEPVGKYAKQYAQQNNYGYHAATGGIVAGADYRVLRSLYLGAATGYTFTDLHWKDIRDKALINSYYGALYGTWFNRRVFVDSTLIGSYNHYHAERVINFPGVNRTARNGHGGYELSASLGTGLFFYPSKYQVQPYARADYIFLHQGAIREHGAQSLDLNIAATDSRYVRTDLGCKVLRCYNGRHVKYVPYLKASWVWEQQLDHARFRSSFAGTSCSFTSEGLHPVRSLFAPSIGMTVLAYDGRLSFGVHDDVEVSSQSWENRGYFNFSYRY